MTTTEPSPATSQISDRARQLGVKLWSGEELVDMLDKICEGMTQEEREALADELDPKWRDDGGPEWRTADDFS